MKIDAPVDKYETNEKAIICPDCKIEIVGEKIAKKERKNVI